MCNVDTGVLGQLWYDPAAPKAFPDFHTTHRCKNYDDVRQWADKLQVGAAELVGQLTLSLTLNRRLLPIRCQQTF